MIMNNIMLDLETLGSKPGCIVAAIGAVEFGFGAMNTPVMGRQFYIRIDPRDAQKHGLTLDADTFLWWLNNSQQARQELTNANACPLLRALGEFEDFYKSIDTDDGKPARLWGNGSDFDQPILAANYEAAKMKQPWSHYQNRCYRTLKNLCRTIKIEIGDADRHHALEDAKAQARHALKIAEEMKLTAF